MTTVLDRPHPHAHRATPRGSNFSGTLGLLRLYLRRDRVVAPLWILLLSVPLATVYVGSIAAVYPTQADRAAFAATIMASPAQRALYGNVYGDSLGATGIWKAGMFHVLIAVAVILTMIRHTRADEETGRAELIDSTAVGRYANLTAALLLCGGASILTGLIGIAGLLTVDVPAAGSVAFGLALACSGLVFTAVAAVTAQLSPSARFARGAAFGALAVAFTLRAVGDADERIPVVALAARLGTAGETVRGQSLLGAAAAARDDCGPDRRRVPAAGAPRRRVGNDRRTARTAARRRDVGRPDGVGVAAEPRLAGAVDDRAVPLRPVDRQRRQRHRRRDRQRRHGSAGRRASRRNRCAGTGIHRDRVQHARHGRLGVRHLADAAAASGRGGPARRDAARRRRGQDALAGKPSRHRHRGINVGAADRRPGGRPGVWRGGGRRRGQAADGARDRGRSAARGVAAGRRDGRVVRRASPFHAGGVGCARRVHRAVSSRLPGQLAAMAAGPDPLQPHPARRRRHLRRHPAAVAARRRRRC